MVRLMVVLANRVTGDPCVQVGKAMSLNNRIWC